MPYKDQQKKRLWQRIRDARDKEIRASNADPARWILVEARRGDKRSGLACDLTKEKIASMIAQGCAYCGETELRMTLDRIDNAKAHTADNVVPACIRCNYARRHMPYQAWSRLAPGMKEARELGLFGGWTGRTR